MNYIDDFVHSFGETISVENMVKPKIVIMVCLTFSDHFQRG